MMLNKQHRRVLVQEEGYAVVARVAQTDENGEQLPQSERIATAIRVAWTAEQRCGRPVKVVQDEDGPAAVVELGDAPEAEFEETAGTLLEIAASW